MELIGKQQSVNGSHRVVLPAILSTFSSGPPQHHLRVIQKILVDRESVLSLPGLGPVRRNVDGPVPLLQEEDVGDHFGSGIGLEGIVGQPDGPQQLGPLGQIPAHGGILGIHCVAGGYKSHHAAGAHLIQRLGKEIIVDVEAQLIVGTVVYLVLSEGDVAHGQVIEVPPVGGLKARHRDVGLGVKLSGDATRNTVQFHAIQPAFCHAFREHPEEVAHTHRRLQNIAALEAHAFHGLIDGADHGGAGVVGVEGGGPGRSVFLRGQQLFQFGILRTPCRFVRVKDVRQTAPAHILREQMLFFRGSIAVLLFDLLQRGNRLDVAPELFLRSAGPQIIVQDAEVFRRMRLWRHGFRLVYVQPFHHHIIGQAVLVAGINRYRLGDDLRRRSFSYVRRKQSGVALILAEPGFKLFPADHIVAPGIRPGVNADRVILNGINRAGDRVVRRGERHLVAHLVGRGSFQERGVPVREAFRVLKEAVQLLHIQSPKKRCEFTPAICQNCKFSFLLVQNLNLNAGSESAVVRHIAGCKVHRLHTPGIQFGKALGDSGVALAIPQPAGNILFVLPGKQAGGQHFPQVLVYLFRVSGKELGNGAVPQVIFQKLLEPFPALSPEDGVSHAGRKELHRILPQLRDLVFLIVQIDRIALMVDRRSRVIDLFLRDGLLDGLVFLIGNGNVDLMGWLSVPDGDGVSRTGDGLAG